MGFRTIDSQAIWQGCPAALRIFARAFTLDCAESDETFCRAYGWKISALESAKAQAFGRVKL